MKDIEVEGIIVSMKDHPNPRTKHARAVLSDETGRIGLDLWRGQITQVKVGDKILLKNAFVRLKLGGRMLNSWDETIRVLEKGKNSKKIACG